MTYQTKVSIEVLRTLHRIHRQLGDLRNRLGRGPRVAHARQENVKRLEQVVVDTQAENKSLRVVADEKQLQLRSGEQKIAKHQQQLNAAKSNVEYQALKDQMAATRMTNSVLEDEILEAMEKVDECHQRVQQAEADLAKARVEAGQTARQVEEQEPRILADIERLEAELTAHEQALPADFLEAYMRVVRHRGEDALAPLDGEFCGGCNQHVPLNMCSQVMLSKPVFCKSCGRLLYLPEGKSVG